MKTIGDAVQCIMGPGGAVMRSMFSLARTEFVEKAEQLGRQIATDNKVPFELADLPVGMPLSETATQMLSELEAIKRHVLVVGPTLYRK